MKKVGGTFTMYLYRRPLMAGAARLSGAVEPSCWGQRHCEGTTPCTGKRRPCNTNNTPSCARAHACTGNFVLQSSPLLVRRIMPCYINSRQPRLRSLGSSMLLSLYHSTLNPPSATNRLSVGVLTQKYGSIKSYYMTPIFKTREYLTS